MSILSWLFVGGLAITLFWLFTRPNKDSSSSSKGRNAPSSLHSSARKAANASRLPPIPSGYQIYAARISIAGLHHRKDEVLKFVRSDQQSLEFEREPSNVHDRNAIKVIGVTAAKRYFLGYVPAEVAEQIVGSGLDNDVKARLERAFEGDSGYLDVIFQIIGPKEKKEQYYEYLKAKPASSDQKEFYKFFGLSVPRGLTTGQAQSTISEHISKLRAEDPSRLSEWEAYRAICDEVDDEDFGENYDVKRISRSLLNQALEELKKEGVSLQDVADDIDLLVEKIFELKPSMERVA